MANATDQRKARLAEALRDNLKRRKDQARVKASHVLSEPAAAQTILENKSKASQKSAPKRN